MTGLRYHTRIVYVKRQYEYRLKVIGRYTSLMVIAVQSCMGAKHVKASISSRNKNGGRQQHIKPYMGLTPKMCIQLVLLHEVCKKKKLESFDKKSPICSNFHAWVFTSYSYIVV